MNPILLSVLIVSAIGLLAGLGLAVASIVMAVPVDEKAEALEAVLPGANCGACGFSGCAGYAKALSEGKTRETALCAPGGNAAAKEIAAILGLSAGNVIPMAATVLCRGNNTNTGSSSAAPPHAAMAASAMGTVPRLAPMTPSKSARALRRWTRSCAAPASYA